MIELQYNWLLAILPLPLLLWWILPTYRESRVAVRVPFFSRLTELTGREGARGAVFAPRNLFQLGMFALLWCLLVFALARPQWLEDPIRRIVPSRDLLLAVDLSGSMETEDFSDPSGKNVDRLTAVKGVLDPFLARREGDRVGLIFFGSAAYVQAPFTDDMQVCRALLDEAQVRMCGPKTMLGDAIGLALSVFERSPLEDRVLILLTDGNDTGSRVAPADAAAIARDRGVTIHVVAVGDPLVTGEEALDEESLRRITSITRGGYFHASDRAALEGIYRRIEDLDTRDLETISHRPTWELYHWPLGAAVLLTLVYHTVMAIVTGSRRAPRVPEGPGLSATVFQPSASPAHDEEQVSHA